jgi:hypothetical protein
MPEDCESLESCKELIRHINLLAMVEEVMGRIIADISKYTPTVDSNGCIPVVSKNGMR